MVRYSIESSFQPRAYVPSTAQLRQLRQQRLFRSVGTAVGPKAAAHLLPLCVPRLQNYTASRHLNPPQQHERVNPLSETYSTFHSTVTLSDGSEAGGSSRGGTTSTRRRRRKKAREWSVPKVGSFPWSDVRRTQGFGEYSKPPRCVVGWDAYQGGAVEVPVHSTLEKGKTTPYKGPAYQRYRPKSQQRAIMGGDAPAAEPADAKVRSGSGRTISPPSAGAAVHRSASADSIPVRTFCPRPQRPCSSYIRRPAHALSALRRSVATPAPRAARRGGRSATADPWKTARPCCTSQLPTRWSVHRRRPHRAHRCALAFRSSLTFSLCLKVVGCGSDLLESVESGQHVGLADGREPPNSAAAVGSVRVRRHLSPHGCTRLS